MRKGTRRTRLCESLSVEHKTSRGKATVSLNDSADLQNKSTSSGQGSPAVCRLCHGRFSPRSLRHAFKTLPENPAGVSEEELDAEVHSDLLFHTDFQQLVGVQLDKDPHLSEYICKKCHAKFYKCHNILTRFLHRVNIPLVETGNNSSKQSSIATSLTSEHEASPRISSDSKCLHSLVSWAHHHGLACRSCPDLKEVLHGRCFGSVRAIWGCVDGHRYTMDAQCSDVSLLKLQWRMSAGAKAKERESGSETMCEVDKEEDESMKKKSLVENKVHFSPAAVPENSEVPWTTRDVFSSGVTTGRRDKLQADSDLSDRAASEDEKSKPASCSEDEVLKTLSAKRSHLVNCPKTQQEPKVRKKPGPKPGWKKKFKTKGEELPNIYKCPHQGCSAVYRAPDGLKKHIKEHHEEVRERPCPHPGCNKVFMIDRYLQRHIKLIHTEERNYICDQCGQTFKQRKHLLVHQLRHSGAKPLQCEICGFQCRQRASLKYHMTKHKAEADLEFACLMCSKRFEKAHNLNVHMSMVHPLVQVDTGKPSGQQRTSYSSLLSTELTQQDR